MDEPTYLPYLTWAINLNGRGGDELGSSSREFMHMPMCTYKCNYISSTNESANSNHVGIDPNRPPLRITNSKLHIYTYTYNTGESEHVLSIDIA